MAEQPPAPRVTISDPHRPEVYVDVVGSDDAPPWRPTSRQRRIALALLVAVLVAAVPALWIRHRGQEEAKDKAALAAIKVGLLDSSEGDVALGHPVEFVLRNDGPDSVRILSARIDRAGYPDVRVNQRLGPAGLASVSFGVRDVRCPETAALGDPTTLQVSVQTERGDRTTVPVDVSGSSAADLFGSMQLEDCGLLPPGESVSVQTVGAITELPGSVVVRISLVNRSVQRLRLVQVLGSRGFAVRTQPALPQTLPARNAARVQVPVPLTVTLTVASCGAAVGSDAVRAADDGIFFGTLAAVVVSEQEAERDPPERADLFVVGDFDQRLSQLVTRVCDR